MVIALALIFAYVQKVDRDNEQRDIQRTRELCGLIRISDDINSQLPAPTGPNAELIAKGRVELHRYRQAIGCDQK